MLKEIKLEEALQNLYEDKPVYMMVRIEKENAIEDLFGADAFYTEGEGHKPWEWEWDWEQVEKMIKEGKTAADVADYYGMKHKTVCARLKRKGLI